MEALCFNSVQPKIVKNSVSRMGKCIQKSCSTLNEPCLVWFVSLVCVSGICADSLPNVLTLSPKTSGRFEKQFGNIFLVKLKGGESNYVHTSLDDQQKPRSMRLA